jgi:hypothetical protein
MVNYSNIFVNKGLSYTTYRDLINSLLAEGKLTGGESTEDMLHYTKMNVQRMQRVDKTVQLTKDIVAAISKIQKRYHLLVITEGWCGDAAQIVPVFHRIASLYPDKFDLKMVLRDENLPLIDAHLTNGGRAIPVLLILDEQGELVSKWGPRPALLQGLLASWRAESNDMAVVSEKLHYWYAKDKTLTTQSELAAVISSLS